jgi:Concanavalin A-like lectin/glucanases superfamily
MSLSDSEILELNELCNAVVDGTLSDKEKGRLSQWLTSSQDAREFYVRATGLSASLHYYASEMQTGEPARRAPKPLLPWKWASGVLALAAMIAIVVMINHPRRTGPKTIAETAPTTTSATTTTENDFVARLTGSTECKWVAAGDAVQLGARLRKGQHLELDKGFAEITFDCGAQVVLQGPASLDVNSAWSATLNRGTLKASLPPEAMGFSIANPTVEVVDLGTEFTMFTDTSSAVTDVMVLKGEVEAAPRSQRADVQPIVLREKESRRFAASGVSTVHHADKSFDELTNIVMTDRYVEPAGFAHWSFDQFDADSFKVSSSGLAADAADAQLTSASPGPLAPLHVRGRWNGALRFDGRMYAKAAYPGIAENSPHTVMFWVKVPKDAPLSNAYSMVGWGVNNQQLGSHPIHIVWNRRAEDGPVGVLRTDYGGGYALGTTSLRDGKWHHVAVVFMPRRNDAGEPMEVKEYVDGRLEGEGKPSQRGSEVFAYSGEQNPATAAGTLWLGCRSSSRGQEPRADRFTGDIDELFIADRALEPQEIVRVYASNRLEP